MPAEQYESFFWKNQLRYRCSLCEYDDYSLDNMRVHFRDIHQQQKQKVSELPMPLLFDDRGNQLERPKPILTTDEEPDANLYE